jgi:hypothetical protein
MLVVQMPVKKSMPRCVQKCTGSTKRKMTYGDACGRVMDGGARGRGAPLQIADVWRPAVGVSHSNVES